MWEEWTVRAPGIKPGPPLQPFFGEAGERSVRCPPHLISVLRLHPAYTTNFYTKISERWKKKVMENKEIRAPGIEPDSLLQ
jgi:hypothetical protein